MNRWERRWLILGIGVFFLVRASSVLVPAAVLNIPRSGDDALIYLWKGVLSREGYDPTFPSVRDILQQRYLQDNPSDSVVRRRVRVTGMVAGSPIPVYDLLTRLALSVGLPLKWTFALTELPGVAFMTASFASFLILLVGEAAAGFGLLLLAFAILPNQGISSFIPSTLALSLSMLLWTYLLVRRENARILPACGTALVIAGIHPIGWLYVIMAIVFHAIGVHKGSGPRKRKSFLLYGGMLLAVMLSLTGPWLVPGLTPPHAGLLGGADLRRGFLDNLVAVWSLLKDPFVRKNPLLASLIAAAMVLDRKETRSPTFKQVLRVILVAMLVSLLHVLPGYPAELFSRLFVPAVVVAAGAAGAFVNHLLQRDARRFVIVTLVVALSVTAVFWGKHLFDGIHLRPEVVLDDRVKAQLGRLPHGTSILYGETDIALLSCLLQGADRYGALAFPMLDGTGSLGKFIHSRRPSVIVLPASRALNTLAARRLKPLTQRRHGFYLAAVDTITVRPAAGGDLRGLYVYLKSGSEGFTLFVSATRVGQEGSGRTLKFPVQERVEGWIRIWDPRWEAVEEITLALPNARVWIGGLVTEPPEKHVRWPWKSGATVSYHLRGRPPGKGGFIAFSVEGLLAEYGAAALMPFVRKESPVISDDSGLVFLRTVFAGTDI